MSAGLPGLPPGTRRATDAEIAALAEAARWSRNVITPESAWNTEPELRVIQLPGRELWLTPAEWDALMAGAVAAERARIRQLATDHGAIYFSEPRPCSCRHSCTVLSRQQVPFADLIPEEGL